MHKILVETVKRRKRKRERKRETAAHEKESDWMDFAKEVKLRANQAHNL